MSGTSLSKSSNGEFGSKMNSPHDVPGIIIFQGNVHLDVDTDNERALEEEDAADQQRRDAELEKLLTNAFDDLYDDNESSTSSNAVPDHSNNGDRDNHKDTVTDRYRAVLSEEVNRESQYISNGDADRIFDNSNGEASAMETYMNNRNLVDTMSYQLQDITGGGDAVNVSTVHYQHCFRSSSVSAAPGDANDQYRQTGFNNADQLQVLYSVRVREVQKLTEQMEELKSSFVHEKDQLLRRLAYSEAEKEHAQLMHKQAQGLLFEQKNQTCQLEKKVISLDGAVESLEKTKAELLSQVEASKTSVDTLQHKLLVLERTGIESSEKQLEMFLHNVQTMHNDQIKKLEDDLDVAVAKFTKKEAELERTKQENESRSLQLEARLAEQGDTVNQMARLLEESQRRCRQMMASEAVTEVDALRVRLAQAERHMQTLERELETCRAVQQQQDNVEDQLSSHTPTAVREELHRTLLSRVDKCEEAKRLTLQLETLQSEKQSLEEECAELRQEQQSKGESERLQGLLTEEAAERRALELALLKEGQRAQALEKEAAALRKKSEEECSNQCLLFHEQSLAWALREKDEKHKNAQDILLTEVEQCRKECDSVKELYVNACKVKDETLAALQQAHRTLENAQRDAQALSSQLESEREKTKELEIQSMILLDKLKHERGDQGAAEKAVAESMKQLCCDNTVRNSEEIEKAKMESLLEEQEEDRDKQSAAKLQQVYRDLTAAYAEKLHTMRTEYGLTLQVISDHVRDETMQFCIQQMRQSETKYLAVIKKCKESYEEQISTLQDALERTKAEFLGQEKLKQSSDFSTTEKPQTNSANCCQIKELEEKLKYVELKGMQTEKQLQTTIVKYSAAKKVVHKYKKYTEFQKKHMEREWVRINSGFQKVLSQVQEKLSNLIETEEIEKLKNEMKNILEQ